MTEEVTNLIAEWADWPAITRHSHQEQLLGIESLRNALVRSAAQTTEAKAEAWQEGAVAQSDFDWDNNPSNPRSKGLSVPVNPYRPVAVVPEDPKPWQETQHGECDCVPDLGPSHCHLCGEGLGHIVTWDEAQKLHGVTPKAGA